MNSNLHRDPYTGLWLQRGGSQTGILDEIDTFVEGEKPRERAFRRQAVIETLVPLELLIHLPAAELRGLDLLLDVLSESTTCRVSAGGRDGGRIFCRLNQDVDVEILVEFMIRVRLRIPWREVQLFHWPDSNDRHLSCYLHTVNTSRKWSNRRSDLTGAMPVCLESNNGMQNPALGEATIEGPRTGYPFPDLMPVTDSIVSWVLWAEAGFPDPPSSLMDSYRTLTGHHLPQLPTLGLEPGPLDYFQDPWEVQGYGDHFHIAMFWESKLEPEKRGRWNLQGLW